MKIEFSKEFIKVFKKRFSHNIKVKKKYYERTKLFQQNPSHPILKDHALSGDLKRYRSFSVTGDIRVVYYIKEDTIYFVDIGTHNQVYGK